MIHLLSHFVRDSSKYLDIIISIYARDSSQVLGERKCFFSNKRLNSLLKMLFFKCKDAIIRF